MDEKKTDATTKKRQEYVGDNEQPIQQVDLEPAGQTCQTRVPIG